MPIRIAFSFAVLSSLAGASLSLFAAADAQDKMVNFSVSEGTGFSLSVSPDEQSLVMDLQGQLWIVPGTGGEAQVITADLDEWRLPEWSPDGRRIVAQKYVRDNFQIFLIDPDGSNPQQLTFGSEDGREPSWSQDGQILFTSVRDGSYDILSVDPDSREIHAVVQGPADEFFPAQSPDGAWLAYVREGKDGSFVVAQGNNKTFQHEARSPRFLVWTRSSDAICFHSAQRDNFYGGWTRHECWNPVSGETWTLTDEGEDVFPSRVSWLDNGSLLYPSDGGIRLRGPNRQLNRIPFTAGFSVARPAVYPKKDHAFNRREAQPVLGILRPAVSPAGNTIAFTALGDLWLREDSSVPVALTHDPWVDIDPAWSPDGRTLAFLSDRAGNGTMHLYLRDMETGADRRLTANSEDLRMPAWSPDGSRIAVFMRNSLDWHATNLYIVDVASGEMTQIPGQWFLPSAPTWSPDGRTIATMVVTPGSARFREGFNEFLFISVESGATRTASPSPGQNLGSRAKHGPVWSPDGRHLAFIKDSVLWLQPVGPDGSFIGPANALTQAVADAPSWAADSDHITFLSLGKLKRISVADGNVEDLPLELGWRRSLPKGDKLIHAGRLFDGVGDGYQEDMDILVRENRIRSVSPHREHPAEIEVIDATERTVLPGLFQMHVHHFDTDGEWDGRNWLAYGITSVREPGADPYEALERRESWNAGNRLGPRLFYAGIVEGNRAYYWMNLPITGEAQLALELERAAQLDYDFIKTYEWLDHGFQRRITEFAHDLGITVASHEIYPGAKYGVDVAEHLGTSDRMETSDRISMRRVVYADVVQIMAHSGMAIVPTAAGRAPGTGYTQQMLSAPGVFDLPQFRAIPERFQISAQKLWDWQRKAFADGADVVANERTSIARLAAAGVLVTSGTDGGTDSHGYSVILEIKHFADSAMGAAAALKAATIDAARATGVDRDLGSIEPGKLADLVIVDGDPLADMLDLYQVETVIRDGQVVPLAVLLAPPAASESTHGH